MTPTGPEQFVAIACGGTGGHLFPGIAVGEKLLERGCEVALLVSNKEIDQLSSRGATGMEVVNSPAVPWVTFPSSPKRFGKASFSFAVISKIVRPPPSWRWAVSPAPLRS